MSHLAQSIFLQTLTKHVLLLHSTRIKVASRYLNINTVNLMRNSQKTAFFDWIFRLVSGFPSIPSERVVGSLWNLVSDLPRKIPRPTIYHSSIYLLPFKSLRPLKKNISLSSPRASIFPPACFFFYNFFFILIFLYFIESMKTKMSRNLNVKHFGIPFPPSHATLIIISSYLFAAADYSHLFLHSRKLSPPLIWKKNAKKKKKSARARLNISYQGR